MNPVHRRFLSQPALTPDDERTLDREALVVAGMKHVVQRALALGVRGDALDDAVQAGALGLMTAVDRFDPTRGVRLATYAWPWIEGAIKAELRRRPEGALEPPADTRDELVGDLPRDQADVITLRFGVDPHSRREVAALMSITESRVRTLEAEAMRHLRASLDSINPRASASAEPVLYSSIGRAADC